MVAFLKTLKTPAKFANPLDDPAEAAAAGRGPRRARSVRQSRRPSASRPARRCSSRPASRATPRRESTLQALGGRDAEVGAAAQEGAGRGGVHRPPRQGDRRQGLADAVAARTPTCRSTCTAWPTARRSRSIFEPRRQGGLRARREARRAQARPVRLRLHRLPRPGRQQMDPRPVAGRAQGPVRPFPAVARPAATRSGTSASACNGATSRCAPTSCRPMRLNMASWNSICAR